MSRPPVHRVAVDADIARVAVEADILRVAVEADILRVAVDTEIPRLAIGADILQLRLILSHVTWGLRGQWWPPGSQPWSQAGGDDDAE